MALQLVRASTSMGAQLEEAEVFSSRRDLAAKLTIALREAREANYWLRLLAADLPHTHDLAPEIQESSEFVAMLTTSVKKLKSDSGEG
jgi:four helix bundle protein